MNNYLFIDAVSYLDTDLLAKHLEKKDKLRNKLKSKRKLNILRWSAVAACLMLLFVCLAVIVMVQSDLPKTSPDEVHSFLLTETCEGTNNGQFYSVMFDNVYLTREINGLSENSGGYLVFSGNIKTKDFSFLTDSIELEINIDKITSNNTKITFLKELSKQISQVDLLFDEQEGDMDGKFCLVFLIDEKSYSFIENKTEQTSFENNQGVQIRLHSNIFWGGGKTVFDFWTKDVQPIVKYVDE